MMSNPIIRKEVVMSLRTKKALGMQAMFLVGMAGLVWLNWPADGLQDIGGQKGRQILSILALGQLAMVALFAPAFTAAAMTSEKERKTLESLCCTAMRPWEIAIGKMVGSLAFLVLLVLSGAPALACPLLLGGVSGMEVLGVLGLLLLTAVYLGSIGLLVSTIMHRSYRAIIVTYAILLVLFFLFAMPAWPISHHLITMGGPASQTILHTITSLSPLEAMLSLLWTGEYVTGAQHMPPFWAMFIGLSAMVVLGVAVACIAKLSKPINPPRPRERLMVVERGKISARSFLFLIDPNKRKAMIKWFQNPILMKEFRTRPMLQPQWMLRTAGICLIVSILLMFLVAMSIQGFVGEQGVKVVQKGGETVEQMEMVNAIGAVIAAMMVIVVSLIGPAMSSGAISSDRETGVWELVRATRMPSWRIVSGKFQASIIPLVLLALSTAPALLVLLYIDKSLLVNVVRVLEVVGVTVLFVSSAGLFFSSLAPRTSTATAWTYGLVIGVGFASLLMLLGADMFSARFVRSVFMLNPVAAALDAVGSPFVQAYSPLYLDYMKIMGAAAGVLFLITVIRVYQLRRPD